MYDLSRNAGGFKKIAIYVLNLSFKNLLTTGRLKCCGMEDHTVVVHGCRKTKQIIRGMDGESAVAYGRLPCPAHTAQLLYNSWFLYVIKNFFQACY